MAAEAIGAIGLTFMVIDSVTNSYIDLYKTDLLFQEISRLSQLVSLAIANYLKKDKTYSFCKHHKFP